VLLLITLIPGIGHVAGGARRWLILGPLRIQPGEIAKLCTVIYFASYIDRHQDKMRTFVGGVLIPLLVLSLFASLLLLEPDFGSTVVILSVVFCQLFLVCRLRHMAGVGLALVSALSVLVIFSPYRMKRFISFLDPFNNAASSGYQLIQSLIAVGSGGVSGTGLGSGKQKLYYLPAAHTDFIFAVIAEELGIMGALFVLGLFLVILVRGLGIARRLQDKPYLASLALGCTLLMVVPALLNMGVVLGLLPTKGMVLPLVAYGGTAMIVHLAALGILLRLSRLEE
jgi:cell division protein FtsW